MEKKMKKNVQSKKRVDVVFMTNQRMRVAKKQQPTNQGPVT
jgi:hypothetical protein